MRRGPSQLAVCRHDLEGPDYAAAGPNLPEWNGELLSDRVIQRLKLCGEAVFGHTLVGGCGDFHRQALRTSTFGCVMDQSNWELEVFFDGDCPLCRREIAWMKGRDRAGKVRFTDIASPQFSAADYGKTFEAFMAEIQGRLPDGRWITGVEVFRRLYSAIGFGLLVHVTRWPLISGLLEWGYKSFARRRLQLTGRCSIDSASCRSASGVSVNRS